MRPAEPIRSTEGIPYADERIERLSPERIGELADAVRDSIEDAAV